MYSRENLKCSEENDNENVFLTYLLIDGIDIVEFYAKHRV